MERQTILERLGWKFIRIRGSEYYSNPDRTMERVVSELLKLGIEPEMYTELEKNQKYETELLTRIKRRAHKILSGIEKDNNQYSKDIIAAALDPKNHMIGNYSVY